MSFSEEEQSIVLERVKEQPRTVQEIALAVDRSWVTTEKYLQELKAKTGLINLRTFREGTQGALKIVYYTPTDMSVADEIRQSLAQRILQGQFKEDFDFMDVFQFIPETKKRAFTRLEKEEKNMTAGELAKKQAQKGIIYLSGNLSFVSKKYPGNQTIVDHITRELEKGVYVKILCRVNLSSLSNIEKISHLLIKYPNQIEIRHRYQPLRGMIIDDDFARFKALENKDDYRVGELEESTRIYYELEHKEWIAWLQSVFWQMWRSSISYEKRIKEIKRIVG